MNDTEIITNELEEAKNLEKKITKKSDKKIYFIAIVITILILLLSTAGSVYTYKNLYKQLGWQNNEGFLNKIIDKFTKTAQKPTLLENNKDKTPANNKIFTKNESTSSSNFKIEIKADNKENIKVVSTETCTNYKILEKGFESNKCYTKEDSNDLIHYLLEYRLVNSNYEAAKKRIEITCDGKTDLFKEGCEKAKSDKEKYSSEVEKYEKLIKEIISRGK